MYCELKSLYTHVGQTRLAPLSGQCHWFIAGDSVDHELSRHMFWSLLPDLRASKSASARFLVTNKSSKAKNRKVMGLILSKWLT